MATTTPAASINATNSASAPQFASLYVGDIDCAVTEAILYEIFSAIGPIASIRVCRDSVSRRSLGYAYVNFHSIQDAERALDSLNYAPIKGRPCRIMLSHRDPALRISGAGNVFVKNLDKKIDNKALCDTFSLFGNILSCKVATDHSGQSRGYGFVHYEAEESAKAAMEKLNGMQLGEKTVYVGPFQKQNERFQQDGPRNFTNVYAKHIPESWEEDKIVQVFGEFGAITSHVMMHDSKSRRFVFVNYENFDDARRAVEELHGKDFRTPEEIKAYEAKKAKKEERRARRAEESKQDEERKEDEESEDEDEKPLAEGEVRLYELYVVRAQSKSERSQMLRCKFQPSGVSVPQGCNLYVKNLGETVTDEELKSMFAPFGNITSAKVMCDSATGATRGFGFVCFDSAEDATKAVTENHLKLMDGKPLYVGLHEKRDQRMERMQNRFRQGVPGVGFSGPAQQFRGNPQFGGPQPGMPFGGPQTNPMYFQSRPGMNQPPMGMFNPQQHMMGRPPMPGAGFPHGQGRPMPPGGMHQMQGMRPHPAGAFPPQGPRMTGMPQMQMPGRGGAAPQVARPLQNGFQNSYTAGPQPGMTGNYDPATPLTAAALAAAPPGVQKQMLGEKLFPVIQRIQPELAGKITGMMLEMDNSELLILLESETQLRAKVHEAIRVLEGK